ncbi:F-box protein At5g52880-like [Camellia sinensis]|uniref:F-box protein At5g52880-like n=1 Tax=Camellia sinensis TaxID=4442 RepID=UPI001036DACB|nr:F-box protein At5g52880-like [Camellia sinensis]
MVAALERYEKLGIGESLPRIYQYPLACREISIILRGAYSKLPKNLQSLVFQHTLTAFRLLPLMQTQNAVSAANLLIQSAEAVLPKQKKVLAVTEFKHAKVAHKRRCKDRQEEGSIQLPQDVVVHIFSFLDLQSLLSAASVCWLWNSAASDNHLWHLQHVMYFGDSNNCSKGRGLQKYGILENDEHMQLQMEVNAGNNTDWRDTFKKACKGNSLKKLTSNRGYCGHCDAVVWLSNMKCSNKHCRLNSKSQKIKHISPEQIVEYILHGSPSMISSSDSDSGDSDSDEESFRKLWAIPKHFSGCHR